MKKTQILLLIVIAVLVFGGYFFYKLILVKDYEGNLKLKCGDSLFCKLLPKNLIYDSGVYYDRIISKPEESPTSLPKYDFEIYTQKFASPDELLIKALGEKYFVEHFRKIKETPFSGGQKSAYSFRYLPYVADLGMTMFFDKTQGNISTKEISQILLAPQNIKIAENPAKQIARERGMSSCDDLAVRIVLHRRILVEALNFPSNYQPNRLAWEVSLPPNCPRLQKMGDGKITRIILDAESGQIYNVDKNEPTQAF